MKKAIFFDRDGTLIVDKHYPNDANAVEFYSDCFESLKKLQQHNFLLFIVTNQSGVAKGIIKDSELKAIHERMEEDFQAHNIKITEYFSAPYLSTSNHYYRKPNPGMLKEAIAVYNIDPSQSWMIGDKESDAEAGLKCGCHPLLLSPTQHPDYKTCSNLKECTEIILSV